jgi:cyclohexadieny/prephenate dehydrogenase
MTHLGIIGAGLIGGSIARGARQYNAASRITIIEADDTKAREAQELGLGDVCTTDLTALKDCDLVILATSVKNFERLASNLALKNGAIVSDVASVKSAAVSALKALPSQVHIIPGHPIAGTEHSGLRAGFAELFKGKWHILTPLPDTDEGALRMLTNFWEKLGAHVAVMTPQAHDAAFATTSHLPHAIAFSLMQAAQDQTTRQGHEILQFAANSFGDYTRVAASDPALWRDIFMNNREALLASLAAFNAKIAEVTHMLHIDDGAALERFIAVSRDARKALDAYKEKNVKGF